MKPFRLKHPEPKEADVLSAVLTLLALHPRVAWAHRMNTGAGKIVRKGGVSQFMRWGFRGCPDVIGQLKGGASLLLEVKSPSGEVTEEQEAFISKAALYGACAGVVRSADDVKRLIEEFDA